MSLMPSLKSAKGLRIPYAGPFKIGDDDRGIVRVENIKKVEDIIEWLVGEVDRLQGIINWAINETADFPREDEVFEDWEHVHTRLSEKLEETNEE